jgi:hypothetical protein
MARRMSSCTAGLSPYQIDDVGRSDPSSACRRPETNRRAVHRRDDDVVKSRLASIRPSVRNSSRASLLAYGTAGNLDVLGDDRVANLRDRQPA